MLKQVTIALNTLEADTWTKHECEDICAFLATQFETFPQSGRIYHGAEPREDVTPTDLAGIERLQSLPGPFLVAVLPQDVVFTPLIIAALVGVAAVVLLRPSIPNAASRNTQASSPNNELSERTNKPRPNSRIPDIYGLLRSTPDLLQLPYSVYVNHQQVEYCYMCIGRGIYDIIDIKDGQTLITEIDGTGARVFGPNTSPNSGAAQLTQGDAITEPMFRVDRSKSVNGQVLKAPNEDDIVTASVIWSPSGYIKVTTGLSVTSILSAGDTLHISGSGFATSLGNSNGQSGDGSSDDAVYASWNLDGVYTVSAVAATGVTNQYQITLTNPATVNAHWGHVDVAGNPLADPLQCGLAWFGNTAEVANNGVYTSGSANMSGGGGSVIFAHDSAGFDNWVGPFTVDVATMQNFIANFVAVQGMYKDSGTAQTSTSVDIDLEVTPLSAFMLPTGPAMYFTATVAGSADVRSTRAATLRSAINFAAGRASIRARRVTPKDTAFSGQVVDEVQWRDFYALTPITVAHFGNVTTIQTKTVATEKALSVAERQINCMVTRKVARYFPNTNTFGTEYPTKKAAEILFAVATDPYIGGRNIAEIDVPGIWTALTSIATYFGTPDAGDFCYTFDSLNLSFEETVFIIANAVFCTAYRQGNQIRFKFEGPQSTSVLLFNHRNKIPGSEKRTLNFGIKNNYDSVEYQYVSPVDDAVITMYVPAQGVNPLRIESVGVRNDRQAWFHAWREWNKLKYQNTVVQFEALQEADILVNNDRILVTNNTRSKTADGEIVSIDYSRGSPVVKLSQPHGLAAGGYSFFYQSIDGQVKTRGATVNAGEAGDTIILAADPDTGEVPLSLASIGQDASVKATYAITGFTGIQKTEPFLVTERKPQDGFTSDITAVNYSANYYLNDLDYINHVIS